MNPLPWILGGGWKWLALAALAYYIYDLRGDVADERSRGDRWMAAAAGYERDILRLGEESKRKLEAKDRAIKSARAANKAVPAQVQRLRESANAPKDGACVISDTLREVESQL